MSKRFPARLHVLLARDRRTGVVIRRGPSKSVCTIGWDLRRDTFQLGQWMRGRIYERRSDLSPDGTYLIYFAMNGRWHTASLGSWTAISRAPYLKALTFMPKGDCWHGGGLFTGRHQYWLNDGCGHKAERVSPELVRDKEYRPEGGANSECLGVYYPRLLRDGWTLAGSGQGADHGPWSTRVDVFEKPAVHGWVLRKLAYSGVEHPDGRGCYWDEHELVHPAIESPVRQTLWEWAEVDGSRLVWAEKGTLWTATPSRKSLGEVHMLADFNDWQFERIAAPY